MTTSNKEIQEARIKGYFIEATKKILKGEGLKSINVRNIAKEAGYSYATLYNYFKDAKELVFECIKDFQNECIAIVNEEVKNSKRGIPRIIAISHSFMKYFIQYPGIFELFYIERANDLGYKLPTLDLVHTLFDELTKEEWKYCVENEILTRNEVVLKTETLKNLTLGILVFYLNRLYPNSYQEFKQIAERQINNVLI